MTPQNNSCLQTISSATMMAMNRLDFQDMRKFARLKQFALEGYSQVLRGLGSMPSLEVLYCDMSDVNTIALPPDYVKYSKIGMFHNGRLINLGLNNKMMLKSATGYQICKSVPEAADSDTGIYYVGHFYNGSWTPTLYGSGGGLSMGYYRENKEARLIEFNPGLPKGKIVIEYVSTGKNVNGSTSLYPEWVEPMVRYIVWQYYLFNNPRDPFLINLHERLYEDVKLKAKMLRLPTLDEFMDRLYQTSGFKLR